MTLSCVTIARGLCAGSEVLLKNYLEALIKFYESTKNIF